MVNKDIGNADFDCVKIDWESGELVVTGETTRGGGTVQLIPHKYTTEPDYWTVDLIWDQENAIFTSMTPFEVRIPLSSIRGTKGIVLKGKTKTLTLETSDDPA